MQIIVRKGTIFLLTLMLCFTLLFSEAWAAIDNSRTYNFQLTANRGWAATVNVGDEITLEVILQRVDDNKTGDYAMYTMQDEITYDSRYFSLIEDSKEIASGCDFNMRTLDDGIRKRIILSQMTLEDEGVQTPDILEVAIFKLKALKPIQKGSIISRNSKVNTKTGNTYTTTANDVEITIIGFGPIYYAVVFEGDTDSTGTAPSMGGKEKNEEFTLPDNTFRRNDYIFVGWNDGIKTYKAGDVYTMPGHPVTFTAQWEEYKPYIISFDSKGGSPVVPQTVYLNKKVMEPNKPTKKDYTFDGWYIDSDYTKIWNFSVDTVTGDMTLYAKWKAVSTQTSDTTTSGGGGSKTPPKEPEEKTILGVPVAIVGTTATLKAEEVNLEELTKNINIAEPLVLDLSTSNREVNVLKVPGEVLGALNLADSSGTDEVKGLKITLTKGEIEFDKEALKTVIEEVGANDLEIIIEEASEMTAEQKSIVKDAPAYNISLLSGNSKITKFKGNITVYLPYVLKPGQSAEGVVVYYVEDNGRLVDMKANYDPVRGLAYFTTTHLSVYIVNYRETADHTYPSSRYVDVEQSAWYREAVDFVIEKGLFMGTGETTFEPNTAMSRAMLVTVLWRLEGNPTVTSSTVFKDVKDNIWYTDAVAWANANKIVSGYGNNIFGPDDSITREQMASILFRYAEYKGYDVSAVNNLSAFTDIGESSEWALAGIKWAVANKLITGTTPMTLEPKGAATRAQVATILMRFIDILVK